LNIKKADDKPLVIHTKQKTRIHAHEPKSAAIKGSNIYTVDRNPKRRQAAGAKAEEGNVHGDAAQIRKEKKHKIYRKSTVHANGGLRA